MKNNIIRSVRIVGTGSYLPDQVITNLDLEKKVNTTDPWIFENLGIRTRHLADSNQATSDLAKNAALRAMQNAGVKPEEIDLIIVATATPDRMAPSTACIVQEKIGAFNAAAFDVAAVCSGFIYALSIGAQFISANVYDTVLVIGADTFSRITDWNDRACVFFGDGAGAVVLTHTNEGTGLLASDLYADGRGKWNFTVPAGGSETPTNSQTVESGLHFYKMNGKAVFDTATKVLPTAITNILMRCNLNITDVDYLIPHQPSKKILQVTADKIGLPFEKVLTNMECNANTAGASVPILLDEANKAGLLENGSLLVLAAVGSGWTWAVALIRWVK